MKLGKRRKYCMGIIAATVLMFSLSGCVGQSKTSVEEVMTNMENEKASTDAVNIQLDDVILKVGEEEVSYQEVLFYIYQVIGTYKGSLDNGIWDVEMSDGSTFENYSKEEIMKELTEVKIICQQAKADGVTLSEDEMVDVRQQAKTFLSSVSEEDIEKYGFDEDFLVEIYSDHALANKMYDVTTGQADITVSDDEARQYSIQYLQVMTNGTDKDGNTVTMTDDEKASALKKAKSLLKKAKKADDFYSFAQTNTDSDTIKIVFGSDDKPDEFGDAAMQLSTGEFSDVIEGDSGYYIVYCVSDNDEDATMAKKEEVITEKQNEVFKSCYTEWSGNYEVVVSTKLWQGLSFETF